MEKVMLKALSLMLAFMMMFGTVGVPVSAASTDAKAQSFCKKVNKGNKFQTTIGSYKISFKKKGNTYNFTVVLNTKLGEGAFSMLKSMMPDKYQETVDGFKNASLVVKKNAKKAGIKKASVRYIVKSKGVKLFECKNGKLVYEKFK